MADLVETVIEDPRWDDLSLPALAETAVRAVFSKLDLAADGFEIALLGTDNARVMTLNSGFRGKPQPTNVLSWPSQERAAMTEGGTPILPKPGGQGPEELGDIALAYETCAAEAQIAGRPLADHVTHLVVHGCLHLLGYDHIRDGDATLMERLEAEILASLGLADPYS